MSIDAEPETLDLLRLVTETTAAERTAQRALDVAENEFVMNPSLSGEVHDRLRADAKAARRFLRDKRSAAEVATARAEDFLKGKGRAASAPSKTNRGLRGIRWPIRRQEKRQ